MKIKPIIAVAGLVLTSGVANAAHMWEDPNGWMAGHFTYVTAPPLYTGAELSFDAFGSYVAPERHFSKIFETDIKHDGVWGGGVGLNYFFIRNVGISADMNMPANGGNFIDNVSGSLIVRVPIGESGFAPYIFGGGGRGTDPEWEWQGHAGVGAEYRFNPTTGLFIDSRYVWADKTFDRILFRAGLRLVF